MEKFIQNAHVLSIHCAFSLRPCLITGSLERTLINIEYLLNQIVLLKPILRSLFFKP